MASPFAHPAMASLGAMLSSSIEPPAMPAWYVDGILNIRVLAAVLVLWTIYCFCGAVYRCMNTSQLKAENLLLTVIISVF